MNYLSLYLERKREREKREVTTDYNTLYVSFNLYIFLGDASGNFGQLGATTSY